MKKIILIAIAAILLSTVYLPTQTTFSTDGLKFDKLNSENSIGMSCYLSQNYAVWIEYTKSVGSLFAYDLKTGERFRLSSNGLSLYSQSENRLYLSGDYCAFFNSKK